MKPKCEATELNPVTGDWQQCKRRAVLEYRSLSYVMPLCLKHLGQSYV